MLAGIEAALPPLIEQWQRHGFRQAEIILAGFSAERERPEAYVIETSESPPVGTTLEEYRASEYYVPPYTLKRLPDVITGPCGEAIYAQIKASRYKSPSIDDDPEVIVWDLHKQLEMQRQTDFGDGIYWTGGYAHVTTLAADGSAEQRVVARWEEDFERVGEFLMPTPMDWGEWHREHPKPANH
jgi:hypothetical protein